MNTDSLLCNVITKGGGNRFYRFSNADGKTWIMPARNMTMAMNLYQPSGIKGKMVKWLLPWIHMIPAVREVIHAEVLTCDLSEDLKELISKVCGIENPEFAIFCGTPCVHRKFTIQIYKDDKILCYCKVSDSDDVFRLFKSETDKLNFLNDKDVPGIPKCLYCGQMKEGVYAFAQTTGKNRNSKVPHEWNELHDKFLQNLSDRTVKEIRFEESDFYHNISSLRNHSDWLPTVVNKDALCGSIDKVIGDNYGKTVTYSAYHADFTPWNMFENNDSLFVFDWEYASLSYPPLLDRYHFFTQTAYFEKHWSASRIMEYMESEEGKWIDRDMYVCYILDVMSRFTLRENGIVIGEAANPFVFWNELLEYLMA